MTDRMRIYNRQGMIKTEFTTAIKRAYAIGDKTTASFEVSTYEDYCNEDNLLFGNWVLVESTLFPAWVGQIGSMQWDTRSVTVNAFSPEYLLSRRIGPLNKVVNNNAGGIFATIIEESKAMEGNILQAGDIYKSETRTETLNPTPLSDDLKRIAERSGEEYRWRPFVNPSGRLVVYGDWVKKLGADTNFTLYESASGGNVEGTTRVLIQDAPKANYLFGYGGGQTWTTKPYASIKDNTSMNKYGLIQKSVSYNGVTTQAGVIKNISDEIFKFRNPSNIYNVNAIDISDTFSYMQLGNRLNLQMQNIGFTNGRLGTEARVRIIGMFVDPMNNGKIELVLEDVNNAPTG